MVLDISALFSFKKGEKSFGSMPLIPLMGSLAYFCCLASGYISNLSDSRPTEARCDHSGSMGTELFGGFGLLEAKVLFRFVQESASCFEDHVMIVWNLIHVGSKGYRNSIRGF